MIYKFANCHQAQQVWLKTLYMCASTSTINRCAHKRKITAFCFYFHFCTLNLSISSALPGLHETTNDSPHIRKCFKSIGLQNNGVTRSYWKSFRFFSVIAVADPDFFPCIFRCCLYIMYTDEQSLYTLSFRTVFCTWDLILSFYSFSSFNQFSFFIVFLSLLHLMPWRN